MLRPSPRQPTKQSNQVTNYPPPKYPQLKFFSIGFEPSDVSRFIGNFKLKHEDFDVHARNYSIFRVQDYFWKEHGFELVRRFLPDAATLLDEEFDHIYNMTYNMYVFPRNVTCY